ncbi:MULTISPECIES: RNA polymerase subunit sigma [Rhodococcus]|uniref:RNA polymerase subunit sigma n=1 Tax=Rhodococcus opacus TaxID=37919 RepID=A0AAX3Y9E5_RHOOP|nr:RNA polymerase subunit sigma [Rhodococcus opacus]NHU48365.1 RNA polymerase subunit sigma [Rhodococcus sp. A14]MBA8964641.1 RNA polymerase sigma-70 factor (ECF subfamily) [Rhodococcus opacus]MBP2207397.1 RNA polymerase sigma-70 factor (ECF subfamily) [Rhodococcus opacus]MCZ4586200.1 RNA polymerase subunit sigma [Rhodococcus opacus]QZS56898.1 RNA polymerase subunit sigma [Rhodococcus opacus]
MRPSFRLDSFDRLAAASRGGDRDAMSRLHAAIRPMAIRRCPAELDPAVADSVADGACSSVLHMLADRPAAGEPFLHLLNTMTSGMITRTVAASCGRRAPLPAGLEVLCARERDVLILRLIVGLGAEDTATSLGRTPGEVLLDQHRALRTLRGVLADRGTVPL